MRFRVRPVSVNPTQWRLWSRQDAVLLWTLDEKFFLQCKWRPAIANQAEGHIGRWWYWVRVQTSYMLFVRQLGTIERHDDEAIKQSVWGWGEEGKLQIEEGRDIMQSTRQQSQLLSLFITGPKREVMSGKYWTHGKRNTRVLGDDETFLLHPVMERNHMNLFI